MLYAEAVEGTAGLLWHVGGIDRAVEGRRWRAFPKADEEGFGVDFTERGYQRHERRTKTKAEERARQAGREAGAVQALTCPRK